MLELDDGRELFVQGSSDAVGFFLFLEASGKTTRIVVERCYSGLGDVGTCLLVCKGLVKGVA